ncbi:unnamed protein product [Dibothriocephalus latus]|uniref:KY-like immunoglobulin-like domain-containing protein n=1 Tax=Dibothriocephalus latus TaxID=60516 RepID=A0A3P7LWE3_DIBLA|nr:unnamed protein product [Dibothriocephalus latus]
MIGCLGLFPSLLRWFSLQILQQAHKKQVEFLLRFPRKGFFKLQLYALPAENHDDSPTRVYSYLIEASTCYQMHGPIVPFPKQSHRWRRGCYLKTPIDGILGLDDNGKLSGKPPRGLPFSVSVPNAIAVAVVVGDECTALNSEADRWKGNVHMKQHWGKEKKLTVRAKYSASDTEYSTLLEYSLAS